MNDQTKNKPAAIILADTRLSSNLETIFGKQDLSSLMIAGYSVIEHILMELQDLGIQDCIVLSRRSASDVQALIGDTRRWGMNISAMNYSLSKEQVLREYKSLSQPNGLLIIEADCLRSRCIANFLHECEDSCYSLLEAKHMNESLGITLLKANESDFIINAMPIQISDIVLSPLRTSREFHNANFDVVVNNFPGLEPSVQINTTIGERQHWASRVQTQVIAQNSNNMIARHCMVGKGALLDSVILNHDVYVERNAKLSNAVVMPDAIISAERPIANAIINGNMVYQV